MAGSTEAPGARPRPRVWTEETLSPASLARLERVVDLVTGGRPEDLPGVTTAIIGGSIVDGAFLDRAGPALKMVARLGIGYERVDVPACTARGVLAVNTPDGPTESTAEHTVTLLLAMAKRVQRSGVSLRADGPGDRASLEAGRCAAAPSASSASAGSAGGSDGVVDQILQLLAGERPTFLIDPRAWPADPA